MDLRKREIERQSGILDFRMKLRRKEENQNST